MKGWDMRWPASGDRGARISNAIVESETDNRLRGRGDSGIGGKEEKRRFFGGKAAGGSRFEKSAAACIPAVEKRTVKKNPVRLDGIVRFFHRE
jgi:hypothetical protein